MKCCKVKIQSNNTYNHVYEQNFCVNKYIPFMLCETDISSLFVVGQSLSFVQLFATPWTVAHQASLSFTISGSLLRFIPLQSMVLSNLILCCLPLLLVILYVPQYNALQVVGCYNNKCVQEYFNQRNVSSKMAPRRKSCIKGR